MFSQIPLPQQMSQMPGGGLLNAMLGGVNFQNALAQNQIAQAQAKYAPITTLADAASKMAYYNLMGPQFAAKMLGHPDIAANMTPDQRNNLPSQLVNTAMGLGGSGNTGNPINNAFAQALAQLNQPQQSPLERLVGNVKNAFGLGSSQPVQQSMPQNAMNVNPSGHIYNPSLQAYDAQHPEEVKQMQDQFNKTGQAQYVVPNPQTTTSNAVPTTVATPNSQPSAQNQYGVNAGVQAGLKSEGEEAGKIRATTMKDFGTAYQSALNKEATLKDLTSVLQMPEIQKAMNMPIGQRPTIALLKRTASPELKEALGRLTTDTGEIIKDSAGDFKGQFRKGEQGLLNNMKVSDDDNIDVAIGKLQSLTLFNEMQKQRSAMAHDYMRDNHADSVDALRYTDKNLNEDKVRQQIYNTLHPTVTIRSKSDSTKTMTIPRDQLGKYVY